MYYKYPPIYKYIIILILITTFLKYYKVLTKESFLVIAIVCTYFIIIFDYILIDMHPSILSEIYIKKINKKNNINYRQNKQDKQNKENKETNYNYDNEILDDNLTEEINKELEDLDF